MGAAGGRAAGLGTDLVEHELRWARDEQFRRAARAEERRQWRPKSPENHPTRQERKAPR